MLKIFLTGDNHIGRTYVNHREAATLVGARIEAFTGMVQAANDEDCDLFVIAGDLFDNTSRNSKKEIRSLLEQLSAFHGTVAVLPGNHDYYTAEGKVWQYFRDLMTDFDNIMLLNEYCPYPLTCGDERVVLYPALCTSLHSAPGENNLDWLKTIEIPQDGAYHIGIAHGAVEGETIDREGTYFQMSRTELENIPVDLWLIGHTHVPFPRNLTTDAAETRERVFNAGTHVQTDVNCNTEGVCFVLELDERKNVRAKKIVSGNLRFYRKQIDVTAGNLERILLEETAGLEDNSVVEVSLTGAVSAEEYDDRRSIIEKSLERFTEAEWNDGDMTKLISEEMIGKEFPETSFSAGLLTALLDEPKEAQMAYELLKSLKEGR